MTDILDVDERDAVAGGYCWLVYAIQSLPFPIGPVYVPGFISEPCYSG